MWKLFILLFAASATAVPLHGVFERRGTTNAQLWNTRAIDKNAVIPVRIGLAQRNLDKGYDYLMDISHPNSENYGKHWSIEQVNAEFAPLGESIDAVKDWLEQSGIQNVRQTSNTGWISFKTPVFKAEELFKTEFLEYESRDGNVRIGCDEYTIPQHLIPHIDYITPGVKLSPPVRKKKTKRSDLSKLWAPPHSIPSFSGPLNSVQLPSELKDCGANITPPCYRYLYNIPEAGNINIPSGVLGIYEYEDVYSQQDLNMYFSRYAPYVSNGTHPYLYGINGATAPVSQTNYSNSGESDIDFSIAYSLLGPVNISLYQTQGPWNYTGTIETIEDPFLDAVDGSYCDEEEKKANFQCGGARMSSVLSASYETPELFYQSMSAQQRVCNEFMKLSLQGHTIIFSSGDYGVASNPAFGEALCVANGCIPANLNNSGYEAYTGPIFSPNFPSNCPYVLSVGATMLDSNQTVLDPESVMNVDAGWAGCPASVTFSSSGGFANYFPRPSYQDSLISTYLDKHAPNYTSYESNYVDVSNNNTTIGKGSGIYNRGGRAIPDVSANGAHLLAYNQGSLDQWYGTSLATPLWASLIAMINAERAAAGKSAVGFVNPTLYQNPEVLNDIINGTNPGCGTNGFPAVEGWDPSTGIGTPNYAKLSSLFNSLP